MKKIKVSAPGKLMLFGEHAVIYGKPCIVTAVDQRIQVTIEEIRGDFVNITAPEVGINSYIKKNIDLGKGDNIPKEVKFIEIALKNFNLIYKINNGLKIVTKSDFSSKFGFGSSSAVTVALIKALSELYQLKLSNKEIFNISYKTVLEVQGVGSGFDLAAAIWGGTIYFVSGGKIIKPIKTKKMPLIVGYTGIKADTTSLVRKVSDLYLKEKKIVSSIFDNIEIITNKAKKLLILGDWKRLGEMMNLNQGLLESLNVGSQELSNLVYATKLNGAYGAKLSGAGGGDCMIALIKKENISRFINVIKQQKGKLINVQTGAEGVRID